MPKPETIYTYRAGHKLELRKEPDQMVVRALPETLRQMGMAEAEQVSSASSRVTTGEPELETAMHQARRLAPTHHAYTIADSGEEFLITDRILVTFRSGVTPEQIDAFAGRYGLVKRQTFSERDFLFQLTDHTGMNPVKLVVKLTEDEPLVELVDHDLNQRAHTYQFDLPSEALYAREWHLHTRLLDPVFDPRASTRCEDAWRLLDGFGSAEVVIGVSDDGCKLDHPDFNSTGKFAAWAYLRGTRLVTHIDIDAVPEAMYKSGANHGTSCAGVMAGEVDAILTVGAAPGCRLLPIQWESSGPSLFISDSKLLVVLNYVGDKVDILSNSWGVVPISLWSPMVVRRIDELSRRGGRRGQGIVFLWAAGNENCPIAHEANIDVPYTSGWSRRPNGTWFWSGVQTARRFQNNLTEIPGVLHIAALASNAQRSHYSNYGTGIDLCAPTSNSHEYGRLSVPGLGITAASGSAGGVTHEFGGTSSAAPLVAGIAALVISANPRLSALEIGSLLKQTAAKDLSLEPYPRTPPASFDPNPSWDVSPIQPFQRGDFIDRGDPDGSWSPWFGHGKVDAVAAVSEAIRLRSEQGQEVFHAHSNAARAIPDNDPAGMHDTLRFDAAALLADIQLKLDLRHTYIGDLRISLIAPSGTTVVLHNRAGGSANDLQRVFDTVTTPALLALQAESIRGIWTLWIQDLAARDTGVLSRWDLDISATSVEVLVLEESPGERIPDHQPNGIERRLHTQHSGRIQDIEVAIDITHTYIGDLTVSLTSPAGTTVMLHNRSGGSRDNLIVTYHSASTDALQALRAQPITGTWILRVADQERLDTGKLNFWSLKILR